MKLAFSLVAGLMAGASAGDILLSGMVYDQEHRPVAGASVSLDGLAGSVLTGADGTFSLSGSSADLVEVGIRSRLVSTPLLVVRSGAVRLVGADGNHAWTLDAFGPDGRSVARDVPFVDGTVSLERSWNRTILRLKRDGAPVVQVGEAGSSPVQAPRAQSAGSWTLRIAKDGYAPEHRRIPSLTLAGLDDTLVVSSPWIPSGTLARSGGQVKILAKGHSFAMGSSEDYTALVAARTELAPLDAPETPRHSVSFTHDFWMDSVEVSQKEWTTVMAAHYGQAFVAGQMSLAFGMGDDVPVYAIYDDDRYWSAGGAILFANARSVLAGLDSVYTYRSADGISNAAHLQGIVADYTKNGFRLPTEAEWEYAARGGTNTDTWWGQDLDLDMSASDSANLSAHAVWAGNSLVRDQGNPGYGTNRSGSKPANPYGLHDMLGNLSEWCDNAWSTVYPSSSEVDPPGEPTTDENPWHAIRGGNWGSPAHMIRAANRTFYTPAYQYYFAGFRLVRRIP